MNQENRIDYLINYLKENEDSNIFKSNIDFEDIDEKRNYLRALMNVRIPYDLSDDYIKIQDEYLRQRIIEKGVTDINDLTPIENDIYLWQGDITTLKCDAIVNAANSQMLGCFLPNHKCIDNAIHTYAGAQLRNECYKIMQKQGHEEKTGDCKITNAYNLPCRYILHTVGPIVQGELNQEHKDLLKSCYLSCIKKAEEYKLNSIAFCCISTGVFGFPQKEAAMIAINTIKEYKHKTNSSIKIIFNVFKDNGFKIYNDLLK